MYMDANCPSPYMNITCYYHSFIKETHLNSYYMSSTFLGFGDKTMNKSKFILSWSLVSS